MTTAPDESGYEDLIDVAPEDYPEGGEEQDSDEPLGEEIDDEDA